MSQRFKEFLTKELGSIIFAILVTITLVSLFNLYQSHKFNTRVDEALYSNQDENLSYLAPTTTDAYRIFDPKAEYTLINYFSLDCIECRRGYLLEGNIIDKLKGKVNIIYRNNPLASEPLAFDKAIIAECVKGEILKQASITDNDTRHSKYFEFMNEFYKNYNIINKNNDWMINIASPKYIAKDQLTSCIENIDNRNKMVSIKNENSLSGIIFTPTILLFKNGVFVKKYDSLGSNGLGEILKYFIEKE